MNARLSPLFTDHKNLLLSVLTGVFFTVYITAYLGAYSYADRMFSVEQDFALNYPLFNHELKSLTGLLLSFDPGQIKYIYILLLFKFFGKSLAVIRLMHLPFLLLLACATHDIIRQITRKPLLSFIGTLLVLNMPVIVSYSRSSHLLFLPLAALGLSSMAVYLHDMELNHWKTVVMIAVPMAISVWLHPNAFIIYSFLIAFHLAVMRRGSRPFLLLISLFSILSIERFYRLSSWGLMHSRRIKSILDFDPVLFMERLFRCVPPSLIYSMLLGLILLTILRKHRSPLEDKRRVFVVSSYLAWMAVIFLGQLNTVDPIRLECYVYAWALTGILFMFVIDSLWEANTRFRPAWRTVAVLLLSWPLYLGAFRTDFLELKPYRTFGLHHRHYLSDDMVSVHNLFHYLDMADGTPGDKHLDIRQGGITLYTNGKQIRPAPLYHTLNWLTPPCPPEIYQMQAFYDGYRIRWAPLLFDFSFDENYRQNGYYRDMAEALRREEESPSPHDYLFLSVVVQPAILYQKERDFLFRFTDPPADEYKPLIVSEADVLNEIRSSDPGTYRRYFKSARFVTKQRMAGNFFLYVFRSSPKTPA